MSRIGKKPIVIPNGVTVNIVGDTVSIKGPKGELALTLHEDIAATLEDGVLTVVPERDTKQTPALWGLFRSLLANVVEGVTTGFQKSLELEGVGYRVSKEDTALALRLGFSHVINFPAPDGIEFNVEKNVITVSGIRKDLVGETAAQIRKLRPPEPYKGKGLRYQGEVIRRKAGKKTAAAG